IKDALHAMAAMLERSLERMRGRVDKALGVVVKEIQLLEQRLRKRMATLPAKKASTPRRDFTVG
ncbi:MAG: hypothetical protein WAU74_14840, partial [Pseudolabrys sp.]